MSRPEAVLRSLFWIAVAMAVTYPASLSPTQLLLGHPDVDVWNHAWGYWFVPHQIAGFEWPFATDMIGIPEGGDLYFIDMLGALVGTPIAWLIGPAAAYNGVMILRVAAAGMAGQVLANEVLGRGPHGVFAGLGMATLPFLLAEMSNGISEVVAVHWIAWSLWAGWRVLESPSRGRWLTLGALLGVTTAASFYYGLVSIMMLSVLGGLRLVRALRAGFRPAAADAKNPALGAALSAAVALPFWGAFQWSLHSGNALIVRPKELAVGWILSHNAVDPRTYVMPGDFQSVDLAAYGEAFVHTGYLRWVVIVLAFVGLLKNPKLRDWGAAAAVSLVVGLGPLLFVGDWVKVGGSAVSLPFYWAQLVLPDVAITHPLRLSIGGQIIAVVLAAGGVASLGRAWMLPVASLALVAESLMWSPGPWPVPTSDATIPSVYAAIEAEGPVLDLPGSVGATMATSRYFWNQTAHGRGIPYSPNVRLDSARDLEVQSAFTDPHLRQSEHRVVEDPAKGPDLYQKALAKRYAAIVLHKDLEARAQLKSDYTPVLTAVFGPPTIDGDIQVWTFGDSQ